RRGPASLDRRDDLVVLAHVEERGLLPREAGIPRILSRRRTSHGHRDPLPSLLADLIVSCENLFDDGFRDSRRLDYQPNHARISLQLLRGVRAYRDETPADHLLKVVSAGGASA